jgi:hypothetical protein
MFQSWRIIENKNNQKISEKLISNKKKLMYIFEILKIASKIMKP